MTDKATISFGELTIGYAGRAVQTRLAGKLMAGELTCLTGDNGTGKSTLLRTLALLQPRLAGSITLLGRDIDTYSLGSLSRVLSIVLTTPPSAPWLTVGETVGMGRAPYTGFFGRLGSRDKLIVGQALEQVGQAGMASRRLSAISDGERQKTMIAKALAQQTSIILLDEPTAFLDYNSRIALFELLRRLAHDERKTILLSTHDLPLAHEYADKLITLHKNQD